MQISIFIFRSSSVKIVREKCSRVHHFLKQIKKKMEFAFLCLEDLYRVKSQSMQVVHEQQLALRRRLLEPKERGIENNLSHCNSRHHRALIIVFCPKGATVSTRRLSCFSPYPLLRENIYIKSQAWEKDGSPKNLQQGGMEKYYFSC